MKAMGFYVNDIMYDPFSNLNSSNYNSRYENRRGCVNKRVNLRIIVTHWSSTTFGMLKVRGALLDKGKIIF